jgi:hypothetical protein
LSFTNEEVWVLLDLNYKNEVMAVYSSYQTAVKSMEEDARNDGEPIEIWPEYDGRGIYDCLTCGWRLSKTISIREAGNGR